MKSFRIMLAVALVLTTSAVFADGTNEATGVNSKTAPASPTGGSTQPGGSSNVDDYTQQDEQINIDGQADALVKVLRTNQKNLINDYVVRIFPIKNAVPMEMRQVVRLITAIEGGRSELIIDPVKKEAFMWVVAPKFQIPYIEKAIAALDVPWLEDATDGSIKAYYRPKFRTATAVATLARIPGAGAIGVADDNLFVVDTAANTALAAGEPYRVKAFAKYCGIVDVPIPQMQLEATVYEVELSDMKRLGLDYMAWKNGPGRNLFNFIFWGAKFDQTAWNATSVYDPFTGRTNVVGRVNLDGESQGWYASANYAATAAYLDFLQGVGRARIVTRGKVTVKNGEIGSFQAVDQTLYFTVTPGDAAPTDGIEPDLIPDTTIPIYDRQVTRESSINLGYTLSVRPYIGEETSELLLNLTLSDIIGRQSGGTLSVRSHEVIATVLVQNGQQFCVGGIRRDEDVKETQKIPILGSIPVLGYLFGHEQTAKRETQMVVVLTPRVRLGSEADFSLASEEDQLIRAQVEKRVKLSVPKTEWGFDQWLIGTNGPALGAPQTK